MENAWRATPLLHRIIARLWYSRQTEKGLCASLNRECLNRATVGRRTGEQHFSKYVSTIYRKRPTPPLLVKFRPLEAPPEADSFGAFGLIFLHKRKLYAQ